MHVVGDTEIHKSGTVSHCVLRSKNPAQIHCKGPSSGGNPAGGDGWGQVWWAPATLGRSSWERQAKHFRLHSPGQVARNKVRVHISITANNHALYFCIFSPRLFLMHILPDSHVSFKLSQQLHLRRSNEGRCFHPLHRNACTDLSPPSMQVGVPEALGAAPAQAPRSCRSSVTVPSERARCRGWNVLYQPRYSIH